ncbi:alkaline phosphatase family protein [Occallatibacter savannae]|uniref:alkaline phosphatase family protein n=1 Tax=Occallatibacter savannae TaxID=1002691 RepID=UPI000D6982DA|nr:alkaline phosphatase family protein [Occallatibacter savannae]
MRKLAPAAAALAALLSVTAVAEDHDRDWDKSEIKHVLLISIDGMHAIDFRNCAHGIAGANGGKPYCPNLASLATTGVNYVAASASKPSDSFPGLMTIVSGATPRTMGVYYDVAYDRSLDGPQVQTGNGNGPGPCTAGAAPTGFTTEYEEGIDIDQTKLNGGAPGASLTDGGVASLDPTKMNRDPAAGCAPVYPWQFVRVNTVYGVIHKAGGYTAWSDKHPAYSSVAGRDGVGVLDDFYSPEINSNVIGLPGVTTAGGVSCASVRDGAADLTSWTNSFQNVQCYDTLKVNAILNEIDGKTHSGGHAKTPTLFGMNFQSVSVGQKLVENGVKGGYLDAAGTPTDSLLNEIEYVDDSVGQMIMKLKDHGLYESTLVIITAKHGQSPIDPSALDKIPGKTNNGLSPATLISNQLHNAMPASEDPNGSGIGSTEDDISLIWLTNPSYTGSAVSLLEANRSQTGGGQIFYGSSLALNYNWPGLPPNGDPRTPDIIVQPNVGVIYTGSGKKVMEHGGFAHDDVNVMLLLSNPAFRPRTVFSEVGTLQVAPTILKALGLDPSKLDGVRLEGTGTLPGVNLHFDEQ